MAIEDDAATECQYKLRPSNKVRRLNGSQAVSMKGVAQRPGDKNRSFECALV